MKQLSVFWNDRHECWEYRAEHADGTVQTGTVSGDWSLEQATLEACNLLGIDLRMDQLAYNLTEEGGWAEWRAME